MTIHDLAVALAKRLEEEGITDEELERIIRDAKEEARQEIARMKDTIYREDAIGACAYETIECYEARKAIRALPSADRPSAVDLSSVYSTAYKSGYEKGKADRPQGEWKNHKDEHYCSHCGEVVISDWYTEDEWYDFCPNCGAQMKGADDGK